MNRAQHLSTIFLAACFMLLFAFNGIAQSGDIKIESKSIKKANTETKKHSPNKAMLMSAILPGAGQVYNKKIWKVPIIYAGIGISIYAAIWNKDQYKIYSSAFNIRNDGNEDTVDEFDGIYTDEQLIQIQNYYDKNYETSIVVAFAFYAINILDANVDAHLFEFDVSDDLSMKVEPWVLGFDKNLGNYNGLKMSLKF